MKRDLESLRDVLWRQFENVNKSLDTGYHHEDYMKAEALGALAGPLIAIEKQLAQKQSGTPKAAP